LEALVLLAFSSYSYSSEEVFGTTGNAASAGYSWVMQNVLPQQTGLTVNAVVYRYTTIKEREADLLVHVQNENARGPGYIFRSTDDWSGLDGNTINRTIPTDSIDISYWGKGSIETEGEGEVTDAGVYYSYKYTPCEDQQSDPTCPGYIDYTAVQTEESLQLETGEQYIQAELDRKSNLKAQKEEEEREAREKLKEEALEEVTESLETLLGVINTNLLNDQSRVLHDALMAVNYLPKSYFSVLKGGTYSDSIHLKDANLPDAKKGAKVGLAQQILHQEMVQSQWD